jgi:hypothetical protein
MTQAGGQSSGSRRTARKSGAQGQFWQFDLASSHLGTRHDFEGRGEAWSPASHIASRQPCRQRVRNLTRPTLTCRAGAEDPLREAFSASRGHRIHNTRYLAQSRPAESSTDPIGIHTWSRRVEGASRALVGGQLGDA